jgi:hypothetical protein
MPDHWTSRAVPSRRARALAAAAATAATALLGLAACAPDDLASPKSHAAPPTATTVADAGISTPADRFAYAVQPYGPSAPAGSWTPIPGYAYNSSGGAITFTRLDVGSYSINFEGLSRAGITLDNPSGSGSETVIATAAFTGLPGLTCHALSWFSWGSVSRLTARVDCTNAAGQSVDTPFSVLVVGDGSLPAPSAFALADQPTAAQYTPSPRWSYTSGPGVLRVAHNPFVGGWDWGMGTGAPAGKIHLLNASSAGDACKIAEYKSLGPSVRCFRKDGQPHDIQYQILQASRGRPGRRFGFAWAEQQSTTAAYSPYPGYVYNSAGGAVQVQRLSAGYYRVFFQGLQSSIPGQYENVQLSSFGPSYSTCGTNGWRTTSDPSLGNGLAIWVLCSNQYGQPVDSRFNVMVIE